MFHLGNMNHYRLAAATDFQECMEVYFDETPWKVPEICQWYQCVPLSHHGWCGRFFLIGYLILSRCCIDTRWGQYNKIHEYNFYAVI